MFDGLITGNTHQIKFLLLLLSLTGSKTLLGPVDHFLPSVHCRLGSDLSTLLHTSQQDHITPSQSANLDRGPWENWDESEVSGPTFRQTYQQQQYHSLITSAKIKQFVVRIQLWASDNKETYEHECRGFENLKKYSWQCSAQCGGWGLGYKLDNVLLSELWRDIRFSS